MVKIRVKRIKIYFRKGSELPGQRKELEETDATIDFDVQGFIRITKKSNVILISTLDVSYILIEAKRKRRS